MRDAFGTLRARARFGRGRCLLSDYTATAVVIGGGLAGLETAWELHRRGVRDVLVVEPASGPRSGGRASVWDTARPPHYVGTGSPAAAVGGRSLLWHGVVLRLEPWALAAPWWPVEVVEALRPAVGEGLYDRVEGDLERWVGRPLSAGVDADEVLAGRLLAAGLAGARPVPQAVRDGVAYSPLQHWAGRATAPRIQTGWSAIELVPGRVPGVRLGAIDGRAERVVSGDAVVLAAGALETTRLVLQAVGASGRVPTGLNDHLVQGFVALVPPSALGFPAATAAFAFVAGSADSRSNLFVRVRPRPEDPGLVLLDVWEMGEQLPEGQTSLTVVRGDPPPWHARVHPDLSERDRELLAGQRSRLRTTWSALGASSALPDFPDLLTEPVGFDTASARLSPGTGPQVYAWPLGAVQHEGGSLPLGGDLVDGAGAVRAVPGVHVVGPAVLPRAGAANPSLTTLALARRTGALLAGADLTS